MILRQKIFLAVVIVANALVWAIPNDVVELLARQQHVLLGRYSREHIVLNAAILLISLIGLYIDQARNREKYKRRWFQVLAVLMAVLPTLFVADLALRLWRPANYVLDPLAYRRPPNAAYTMDVDDRPPAAFSYPDAPEGFPAFPCTIRIDARGFRNPQTLERADVVFLGDSFVEGSHVSDEHALPIRFAAHIGLTTYSLGMSGYSPVRYLASLKKYGLALKPRLVVCLLYEGNDIRSTKGADEDAGYGLGKFLKTYVKQSPLLIALDNLMIAKLGPIGAGRDVKGMDVVSWLPVRVPDDIGGKSYAFAPKQITQGYVTEEKFTSSGEWTALASILDEIRATCRDAGCELVIAYAPNKAHVVLPLVADRLPPEKVRAFAAISAKKLPDAATFVRTLLPCLDSREAVVRQWCEVRQLPFVGLTDALRQAVARGEQVYFTYDQHWTPLGHDVAARTLTEQLTRPGLINQSKSPPSSRPADSR